MSPLAAIKATLQRLLRLPADGAVAGPDGLRLAWDGTAPWTGGLPEHGGVLTTTDAPRVPIEDMDPQYLAEEGSYPYYLSEASKLGMDVNDYVNEVKEQGQVLPLLERLVFPYLSEDGIVLELGPGTGRFAREVSKRLPRGELHLVDYSPWTSGFLDGYFRAVPQVHVHLTDGRSLPANLTAGVDVIYSFGTFVLLKLGLVYSYAREFVRVLRPGGHFILEYIDISSPQGWALLEANSTDVVSAFCFTYFTPEIMEAVFTAAGCEIVFDDYGHEHGLDHPCRILVGRRSEPESVQPPAGCDESGP